MFYYSPIDGSVVNSNGGNVGRTSLSYGPTGSGMGHPASDIPGLLLSDKMAKLRNLQIE